VKYYRNVKRLKWKNSGFFHSSRSLDFAGYFAIPFINPDFLSKQLDARSAKRNQPMTQESNSNPATADAGVQTPFPPAEIQTLHSLDREAARNIVCLLGGLFIVGLLLYTFVAIWVH